MSWIKNLLLTEVPLWPFRAANFVIVPLAIMIGGCLRVWATAQTPFEEFSGVVLVIAVALLWILCFGFVLPPKQRTAGA